jgi:gamma-glutamylaminecyclotransferase
MLTVFVYGTLLQGQENHNAYLLESEFLGNAELAGYGLYAVSSYPGIVQKKGKRVKGEIYKVDKKTLKKLDILEGEGSLYIRKQVDAITSEGIIPVFTYIWNNSIEGVRRINYEQQPWKNSI